MFSNKIQLVELRLVDKIQFGQYLSSLLKFHAHLHEHLQCKYFCLITAVRGKYVYFKRSNLV